MSSHDGSVRISRPPERTIRVRSASMAVARFGRGVRATARATSSCCEASAADGGVFRSMRVRWRRRRSRRQATGVKIAVNEARAHTGSIQPEGADAPPAARMARKPPCGACFPDGRPRTDRPGCGGREPRYRRMQGSKSAARCGRPCGDRSSSSAQFRIATCRCWANLRSGAPLLLTYCRVYSSRGASLCRTRRRARSPYARCRGLGPRTARPRHPVPRGRRRGPATARRGLGPA